MQYTEQQFKEFLAAIKNINEIRFGGKYRKVAETNDENLGGGSEQGEYNTLTEIYHISDDLYIKLTFKTDSYGDNEAISGISLVSPVVKQVQDFVEV